MNGGWGISWEIVIKRKSLDLTDGKSTQVQVLSWCQLHTPCFACAPGVWRLAKLFIFGSPCVHPSHHGLHIDYLVEFQVQYFSLRMWRTQLIRHVFQINISLALHLQIWIANTFTNHNDIHYRRVLKPLLAPAMAAGSCAPFVFETFIILPPKWKSCRWCFEMHYFLDWKCLYLVPGVSTVSEHW